jgi:hypothetical protein
MLIFGRITKEAKESYFSIKSLQFNLVFGFHISLNVMLTLCNGKRFAKNQTVIFLGSSLIPYSHIIHRSLIQVTGTFIFRNYSRYNTVSLEAILTWT